MYSSVGRSNDSSSRYYYTPISLRDFLLDSYEDFLTRVRADYATSETSSTKPEIRTPFDLMTVVTDRYLAMQRLRVLGNIDEAEFNTAIRLDLDKITICVVDDAKFSQTIVSRSRLAEMFKTLQPTDRSLVKSRTVETIPRVFECFDNDEIRRLQNTQTFDSTIRTTRLLFVCLLIGCAFVRSETTAHNLIAWIVRMRRTLRLTGDFVVVEKY